MPLFGRDRAPGQLKEKMGVLAIWRRPLPHLRRNVLTELSIHAGGRQSRARHFAKPETIGVKVLKSTMPALAKDMVNIAADCRS